MMLPQTLPGTYDHSLSLVPSVGGVSARTDDNRLGSASRASDSALMREARWTVRFEGQRISCELRYHGILGVEYRLFRDNEFCRGRGFRTRELAVQAAAAVRQQLENDGWSS
jgi:hypothetical protein